MSPYGYLTSLLVIRTKHGKPMCFALLPDVLKVSPPLFFFSPVQRTVVSSKVF